MFANPKVDGTMELRGGSGSALLLPLLNFKLMNLTISSIAAKKQIPISKASPIRPTLI
tara:strand:- start:6071 stop:6244 length:174 start_codon:yes stop_codon:yes gene_type:complete